MVAFFILLETNMCPEIKYANVPAKELKSKQEMEYTCMCVCGELIKLSYIFLNKKMTKGMNN